MVVREQARPALGTLAADQVSRRFQDAQKDRHARAGDALSQGMGEGDVGLAGCSP